MWHGQHLMMPFARPDTIGPLAVAHLPPRGRRRAGARRCSISGSRRSAARAARPTASITRAGRRPCASFCASSTSGSSVALDRRRAEARPRRGHWDRDARQALGAADRPDRGRREPPHPVQHVGPGVARPAVRPRGRRRRRSSSAFRPTPTTRPWRRRGSPCRKGSTRRIGAPTPWSARPIRARI